MDEQAIQKITNNITVAMNQRFAEQDAKRDKRFEEQDAKWERRFAGQDDKLERLDQRFDKLALVMFNYMDKRFDRVENRLDDLGDKFSDLQSSVDGLAGRVTTLEQESQAHSAHHKRLGL